MDGETMHGGKDAYRDARILALKGLHFEAIVDRLEHDSGVDHQTAEAAAAQALAPDHSPISLAAELAAIAALLDR
jgi:hypothetical protein